MAWESSFHSLVFMFHTTNNLALIFSERFTIEECFQHPWIKVMFSGQFQLSKLFLCAVRAVKGSLAIGQDKKSKCSVIY